MEMRRLIDIVESLQVTQTPSFKAWFGNSKVVDDDGNPLVVYHGTPRQISADFAFDPSKKGVSTFLGIAVDVLRHGFFFTSNRNFAASFANQPRAKGNGTILEVYLRIVNPLRMTVDGVSRVDATRLIAQGVDAGWLEKHAGDPYTTYEQFDEDDGEFFKEAIMKAGFDGVEIDEYDPDTRNVERVWIAFSPSQIKAVANKGSFNPKDERIYEKDE